MDCFVLQISVCQNLRRYVTQQHCWKPEPSAISFLPISLRNEDWVRRKWTPSKLFTEPSNLILMYLKWVTQFSGIPPIPVLIKPHRCSWCWQFIVNILTYMMLLAFPFRVYSLRLKLLVTWHFICLCVFLFVSLWPIDGVTCPPHLFTFVRIFWCRNKWKRSFTLNFVYFVYFFELCLTSSVMIPLLFCFFKTGPFLYQFNILYICFCNILLGFVLQNFKNISMGFQWKNCSVLPFKLKPQ